MLIIISWTYFKIKPRNGNIKSSQYKIKRINTGMINN